MKTESRGYPSSTLHLIEIFDPTIASLGPSAISLKSTIKLMMHITVAQNIIIVAPHVYLRTCILTTYIAIYIAMQISNN